MTGPRRARGARKVGWGTRIRALLAIGGVLGLGAVGTLAAWTDQSTATSGSFSTGTIDIKLGSPAPGVDNNPAAFTSSFSLANMAPGATTDTSLVVRNRGSVPFTYTVSGTATNNGAGTDQLGTAMLVQIYAGTCGSGSVLNSPARFTFAATAARPLAALNSTGDTETLCFRATLPAGADTALQGTTTTGPFTFVATSS